jgi:hypothetical protein
MQLATYRSKDKAHCADLIADNPLVSGAAQQIFTEGMSCRTRAGRHKSPDTPKDRRGATRVWTWDVGAWRGRRGRVGALIIICVRLCKRSDSSVLCSDSN